MISHNDLLVIKERLLVASAAARALVESGDPVRYDEEQYWRVHLSLSSLHDDVTAVLGELDTLRSMFADKVSDFLRGEVHAISSVSQGPDAGEPLAPVSDGAGVGSGEVSGANDAEPSSPVPSSRPARRGRRPRSESQGDSGAVPGVAEGMGRGDSEGSLGGPAAG